MPTPPGPVPSSRLLSRRSVAVAVGLLLALLLAETVLQMAVWRGGPAALANPESYAHPLCEAWYWRTRARQAGPAARDALRSDPRLGWLPPASRTDATGAWRPDPTAAGPVVALFGDSFVAGTTPDEERIAAVVQRSLHRRKLLAQVEDHAVGGYGLDQILLRLLDRAADLPAGTPVVIGVLTTDIDRTVLWERDAPKPRFRLDAQGALRLEAAHLSAPMPPPEHRFLLPARLLRVAAGWRAQASGQPHPDCRVPEKQALADALMRELDRTCSSRSLKCLVVPFLRAEDLARPPGWREKLLEMPTAAVSRLRLRPLLAQSVVPLYGADRHPNHHQNSVVAEAISEWVAEVLSGTPSNPVQ